MKLKRGDTSPPLTVTLTDAGTPVNLTGADVRVLVRRQGETELLIDAAPTITTPTSGVIVHDWVDGETDISGRLLGEVEVTYPGGTIQTFPAVGNFVVDITDDLDPVEP